MPKKNISPKITMRVYPTLKKNSVQCQKAKSFEKYWGWSWTHSTSQAGIAFLSPMESEGDINEPWLPNILLYFMPQLYAVNRSVCLVFNSVPGVCYESTNTDGMKSFMLHLKALWIHLLKYDCWLVIVRVSLKKNDSEKLNP